MYGMRMGSPLNNYGTFNQLGMNPFHANFGVNSEIIYHVGGRVYHSRAQAPASVFTGATYTYNLNRSAAQTVNLPTITGHSWLLLQGTAGPAVTVNGGVSSISIPANHVGVIEYFAQEDCTHPNWGNWSTPTVATCLVGSTQTRACLGCGITETIPWSIQPNPLGHDLEWIVTTPATCTTGATETGTCQRSGCSHSETQPGQGALTHNVVWTLNTTPATCTTAATDTGNCNRPGCSHSETRIGQAALTHSMGEWVLNPANENQCRRACTRGGCSESQVQAHRWDPNSQGDVEVCLDCGHTRAGNQNAKIRIINTNTTSTEFYPTTWSLALGAANGEGLVEVPLGSTFTIPFTRTGATGLTTGTAANSAIVAPTGGNIINQKGQFTIAGADGATPTVAFNNWAWISAETGGQLIREFHSGEQITVRGDMIIVAQWLTFHNGTGDDIGRLTTWNGNHWNSDGRQNRVRFLDTNNFDTGGNGNGGRDRQNFNGRYIGREGGTTWTSNRAEGFFELPDNTTVQLKNIRANDPGGDNPFISIGNDRTGTRNVIVGSGSRIIRNRSMNFDRGSNNNNSTLHITMRDGGQVRNINANRTVNNASRINFMYGAVAGNPLGNYNTHANLGVTPLHANYGVVSEIVYHVDGKTYHNRAQAPAGTFTGATNYTYNLNRSAAQTINLPGLVGYEWELVGTGPAVMLNGSVYSISIPQNHTGVIEYQAKALCTSKNWGAWSLPSIITCTTDSIQTRTCGNCGREETQVHMAAPGHGNWGAWTNHTAATCTAAATQRRTCGRLPGCTEFQQQNTGTSLGHLWTGPATMQGQANATTQHRRTCARGGGCTQTQDENHIWGAWGNHNVSGQRTRTCTVTANCTARQVCGVATANGANNQPHTWGNWQNNTPPGQRTGSCTRTWAGTTCGATHVEPMPAGDLTWANFVIGGNRWGTTFAVTITNHSSSPITNPRITIPTSGNINVHNEVADNIRFVGLPNNSNSTQLQITWNGTLNAGETRTVSRGSWAYDNDNFTAWQTLWNGRTIAGVPNNHVVP